MKNLNYDTFLFDLGKVLVDFDHHISAEKIARFTGRDVNWLYDFFFESELTKAFDEGRISPQQFYNQIKRITGLKIGYDEFVPIWSDIFSEKKDVCEFAANLKKDYRIVLISNVNILQFEYISKKFPIISYMDDLVLSCKVGVIKPDPGIFRVAIEASRTSPERVIYTDDRPELIEGAKAVGITSSFVFRDLEGFKADLKSMGVQIDEYEEVLKSD
jgi:putative hydrolase of the HAD superfamily